ncbi:MAG: hypothetical protein INR64_15280, partial [Caulobacteraceae bacterium]|nr:hypothetical protein [Caulobacter sp.]
MLQAFTAELRSQLGNLPHMAEAEIAGCAHAWTSMAGHFGFSELQRAAAELQAAARAGRGVTGAAHLQAAAERAIAAAESCGYAHAA